METPQQKTTIKVGTPRFENHLTNGLNGLMISNKNLDCSLIAGNKIIHVHSVVLSALSPFFQTLFDQQTRIQHPTFFFDTSVTYIDLIRLVNYLYAGEVDLPINEAEKFQNLLKHYQFPDITIFENHDVQLYEESSDAEYISSFPVIDNTLVKKAETNASKIVNIQPQDEDDDDEGFSNSHIVVQNRKRKLIQDMLSTSLPISLDESSIQCVHCLKYFANKNNRLKHEKLCRENPEVILQPCPKCNNKYSTVMTLLRHLKNVHK